MRKRINQQNGLTKKDVLKKIAEETAKMSYPGAMSMSGKGKQIVQAGTKAALLHYFQENFPIVNLWKHRPKTANYDKWHKDILKSISQKVIKNKKGNKDYNSDAISAKFLNTFLHQLMKYEKFRYLYKKLHLPLDSQVFKKLKKDTILDGLVRIPVKIQNIAKAKNAYAISSTQYATIQEELLKLLDNINKVLPKDCKLKARIELNSVLWL